MKLDMAQLRSWVGHTESVHAVASVVPLRLWAATPAGHLAMDASAELV